HAATPGAGNGSAGARSSRHPPRRQACALGCPVADVEGAQDRREPCPVDVRRRATELRHTPLTRSSAAVRARDVPGDDLHLSPRAHSTPPIQPVGGSGFTSATFTASASRTRNASAIPSTSASNAATSMNNVNSGRVDLPPEHTSELQSRENLVCRLLLEKKKNPHETRPHPHTPAS